MYHHGHKCTKNKMAISGDERHTGVEARGVAAEDSDSKQDSNSKMRRAIHPSRWERCGACAGCSAMKYQSLAMEGSPPAAVD